MNSKIYVGTVMHQRHKPKKHILRYRVFSMLLNLEELTSLGRRFRFFSHNAFNLFSIYDKDLAAEMDLHCWNMPDHNWNNMGSET